MPTWPQIAQPLCRLTPGFVEAERCGFDGKVVVLWAPVGPGLWFLISHAYPTTVEPTFP